MRGSLLTTAGRGLEAVGGVWHPDPDPVSITLIRAFARLRAPRPPSCSTDHDPVPRLQSVEVALHVRRHSGPTHP